MAAADDDDPPPPPPTLQSHMLTTLFGIAYDIRHWKKLPPTRDGRGTLAACSYVATHSGRFPYLLLWVTSLCLLVLMVVCVCVARSSGARPAPFGPLAAASAHFRY